MAQYNLTFVQTSSWSVKATETFKRNKQLNNRTIVLVFTRGHSVNNTKYLAILAVLKYFAIFKGNGL